MDERACLYKSICVRVFVSVNVCLSLVGAYIVGVCGETQREELVGGQTARHPSKIADLLMPPPPYGARTKQTGDSDPRVPPRLPKPPPAGTPNLAGQKSLLAQEPYRAELSRERRSHLATMCSILCALRVWNKPVSTSSIYLKGRRVFLRS